MHRGRRVILGTALALAAVGSFAAPNELARLDAEFTPMGAERAGNAEGTIPAWLGGVTEPPSGWRVGQPRLDLFADDPILFSIDASNVDRHADKLSAGQVALLRSYDGYRMDVYPTRRSCGYDEAVYRRARRNVGTAAVDADCNLSSGTGSPLFPMPRDGCETIWNGKTAIFNGVWGFDRMEATLVPTPNGSLVPVRRRQALWLRVNQPAFPTFESLEGVATKALSHTLAPPKQAGEITLVHALVDGHLRVWVYNPGQRRVRRAPNFEYDNPVPGWQGVATVDQVNGFVSAADRYQWKLLGKQELYIPYNNTRIFERGLRYPELIEARYPRRDLIRYELHRVWVVEARVRPDRRHIMPRRIFYLDEDSWLIVASDNYDARGELWRVTEHLPQLLYEVPACIAGTSVYYDLMVGRYVVSPVYNEEEESDYLAGHAGRMTDSGFSPDDLRRLGTR